jgi:SP family general alpha glucoside:H+ symporter-like MFS transporter
MLNTGSWNWSNYTGFFWAGICFLCIVYTYLRVPEPQGRSFAELDLLFERGVSARKFATTNVNVFEENMEGGLVHEYEGKLSVIHTEKV